MGGYGVLCLCTELAVLFCVFYSHLARRITEHIHIHTHTHRNGQPKRVVVVVVPRSAATGSRVDVRRVHVCI